MMPGIDCYVIVYILYRISNYTQDTLASILGVRQTTVGNYIRKAKKNHESPREWNTNLNSTQIKKCFSQCMQEKSYTDKAIMEELFIALRVCNINTDSYMKEYQDHYKNKANPAEEFFNHLVDIAREVRTLQDQAPLNVRAAQPLVKDDKIETIKDSYADQIIAEHVEIDSKIMWGTRVRETLSANHFQGRTAQLDALKKWLQEGSAPAFICGIGGIGKTTLVSRFAVEVGSEFDYQFRFVTFSGSYKETIASLTYSKVEKSNPVSLDDVYKHALETLKQCNDHVILIIDNADVEDSYSLISDPVYQDLSGLNLRVMITTRNDMSKTDAAYAILANELEEDECLALMKSYLLNRASAYNEKDIRTIIRIVNRHTLTLELLAKTLNNSMQLTTAGILDALNNGQFDSEKWQKVRAAYKLNYVPESVLKYLKVAFNLNDLSEEIKNILGCFCLTSEHGLPDCYLYKLFSDQELIAIQRGVDRGWLNCKNLSIEDNEFSVYSIHPVIRALCLMDDRVRPSWEKHSAFIERFAVLLRVSSYEYVWHNKYPEAFFIMTTNIVEIIGIEEIMHRSLDCAGVLLIRLIFGQGLDPERAYPEKIKDRINAFNKERQRYSAMALKCIGVDSPLYGSLLRVLSSPLWRNIYATSKITCAQRYWRLRTNKITSPFFEQCRKARAAKEEAEDIEEDTRMFIREKRGPFRDKDVDEETVQRFIERAKYFRMEDAAWDENDAERAFQYARNRYKLELSLAEVVFCDQDMEHFRRDYTAVLIRAGQYEEALKMIDAEITSIDNDNTAKWKEKKRAILKPFEQPMMDYALEYDWLDAMTDLYEVKHWIAVQQGNADLAEYCKEKYLEYTLPLSEEVSNMAVFRRLPYATEGFLTKLREDEDFADWRAKAIMREFWWKERRREDVMFTAPIIDESIWEDINPE